MSGPRAAEVQVNPTQQALLQKLSQRQTACQRLVRRVMIVLALAAAPCIEAVARDLGLARMTVRLWRNRWNEAVPTLLQAQKDNASEEQLLGLIEEVLDDDDRPGAPSTFTAEQIVQIVAVACEPPEKSGRPISHWTYRELADEVIKRKIVADIHPTTVGLFLKRGQLAAAPQPLLAELEPRRPRSVPPAGRDGL